MDNPLLIPEETKKKEIILSDDQKLLILKRWERDDQTPPSISELVKIAFPESTKIEQDGRSLFGRAIKIYLAEKNLQSLTKTEYTPKKIFELTNEQKEYILNHIANERPFEMGKILFNNPKLSPASTECKAIIAYVKTLDPKIVYGEDSGLEADYKPPKRIEHVLARIFKYVKDSRIDKDKITPSQKKQCDALISYLHDYRLIHQINTYNEMEDKKLFESSFISYTWDKPDLSAEDVHLYIILCTEVVMSASIQRTINMLQAEQDRQMEENEGKISMTIVEAVGTARTEYNGSVKRQETLFKSLIQERSKRLSERVGPQFTLLNIVEEMKNEERRRMLILDAEKRNEKIKGEIQKLSTMDERIVRIWGIDEDLIFNG